MALHDDTGGPAWSTRTNWGTHKPLNTWHGVTTTASGVVTSLVLPGNDLT